MDKNGNKGDGAVGSFAKMRAVRAYKNKHLHQLETVTDYRLVEEIGFHQERGRPLTMKAVYLLGLASVATIQRRLKRLRDAGAIVAAKADDDARVVELTLSPKIYKAYLRYAELLATTSDSRSLRSSTTADEGSYST